MNVYIVIHYGPGGENEIVAVYATEGLAQAECTRLGLDTHGWERFPVNYALKL